MESLVEFFDPALAPNQFATVKALKAKSEQWVHSGDAMMTYTIPGSSVVKIHRFPRSGRAMNISMKPGDLIKNK